LGLGNANALVHCIVGIHIPSNLHRLEGEDTTPDLYPREILAELVLNQKAPVVSLLKFLDHSFKRRRIGNEITFELIAKILALIDSEIGRLGPNSIRLAGCTNSHFLLPNIRDW
jgi:hypothetical protein